MNLKPTTAAPWAAALVTIAALLAATPAQAIGHDAMPHPSPDYQTLYAHNDGEGAWYLATVTGEDIGFVGGFGTTDPGQAYTWTIPLEGSLAGDLVLDPDQTVEMYAYIGRTGDGGIGRVTVASTFTVGDTVVASGSGQTIVYNHEYVEVHWSVAPEVDRIPADGGDVVWTITVTDGVRNGIFLRINDPDGVGASRVTLPIVAGDGGGPDRIAEDLTGDEVDLTASFENATDAIHTYNWMEPNGSYEITYAANVTNGSALLDVQSGGASVLSKELDANSTAAFKKTVELTGNVTITVTFTAFQGDVALQIKPATAEPTPETTTPDPTTPAANDTAAPAAGNNTTIEDGGSLPGFGAAAVAAAVGLAVLFAARRRR